MAAIFCFCLLRWRCVINISWFDVHFKIKRREGKKHFFPLNAELLFLFMNWIGDHGEDEEEEEDQTTEAKAIDSRKKQKTVEGITKRNETKQKKIQNKTRREQRQQSIRNVYCLLRVWLFVDRCIYVIFFPTTHTNVYRFCGRVLVALNRAKSRT